MIAGTRDRRQRDRDQRRAAANRRIGHEMAWAYFWAPKIGTLLALTAVAVGCRYLWTHVDHALIARAIGGVGIALTFGWALWLIRGRAPRVQTIRAIRSRTYAATWHLVGLAGVVLVAASWVLWQVTR